MPPKGTKAAKKPPPKKAAPSTSATATTSTSAVTSGSHENEENTTETRMGESQELATASRHMEEAARAHEILESLPSKPNAVAGGKVIAYFQDNPSRGYSQQTLDDAWRDVLKDGFNINIEEIKASRRSGSEKDKDKKTNGTATTINDNDVNTLVKAFECDKRTANDTLKACNGNLREAMTYMIIST